MSYKSYATKSTTPSRLTRKGARREVFTFNSKISKARRKAARLARRQLAEDAEASS